MKMISAHIYGFGNWVDARIDFSGNTFLCLYGDNESGKSTLRQFLMFMLFGLSPKKRTFYHPKSSSRMGGRLKVFDEDWGEFTIERLDQVRSGAAVCELNNGETRDEAWLRERMNGMTEETYEAIFSFSALDLADIKGMKEEDLGEVLLGVGLTGSSSIHRIEKKLDTKLGELFKPFGKKPAINQQLQTLQDQKQSLQQYREVENTYREKIRRSEELDATMSQLQQELKTTDEQLRFREKHKETLPLLQSYDAYRQQLEAFGGPVAFPENGVARFEKLQDQLLPLKGEQGILEDAIEKDQQNIDSIRAKQHSNDVVKQAEALIDKKQTDGEQEYTINSMDDQLKSLDARIQSTIQDLGIELHEDDLEALSFPFGVEKNWQQLKQTKEHLNQENARLNSQHRDFSRENEQLSQEMKQTEEALLDEKEATHLQQKLDQDKSAAAHATLKEQQANQRTSWEKMKQVRTKQLSVILWLASGFAVVSLLAGILSSNALLITIAPVLLVIGGGQYVFGKRSLKTMGDMFSAADTPQNNQRLTPEEKETIEMQLNEHQQAQQRMRTFEEQARALDLKWGKWEDAHHSFNVKNEQFETDINHEMTVYPFLSRVDVSYWPELFHTLRSLGERFEEKQQLYEQRQQLMNKRNELKHDIQSFFEDIEWEKPSNASEETKQLRAFLDAERNKHNQLLDHEQSLETNQTALNHLKQKMAIYESEKQALFTQAEAEDEDTFWQQAERSQEQARLENETNDLLQQLNNRFPLQYQYMLNEASRDPDDVQQQLNALHNQYKALEDRLENERSDRSRLRAELDQMEGDTDLSALMHRFSMESQTLNELAEEWSVYMTARRVLAEAKRTFREKYIDKVMTQTTTHFNTVTLGVYTSVLPPGENETFRVERHDGVRFNVNELSQGTLDQLYVALRLAIGQIMSAQHHVPYIIDDAFVHFDDERTEQMLNILQDMSDDQQIFLFTCKTNIVRSITKDKTVYLDETVA